MIEIDVKINGKLYDRIHVCNSDVEHMGLTTYAVTTFRGKRFTVEHTQADGLYELLGRVFKSGFFTVTPSSVQEKEKV